jgi:hypothetical protein
MRVEPGHFMGFLFDALGALGPSFSMRLPLANYTSFPRAVARRPPAHFWRHGRLTGR